MERRLFGIAAIIASIAYLFSSIGQTFAYPQGPNVSTGSNPIVSFYCASGNPGYTVPNGQSLVMTDFIGVWSAPSLDLSTGEQLNFSDGTYTLMTGYKVASGTSITCSSGSMGISGYLAHP